MFLQCSGTNEFNFILMLNTMSIRICKVLLMSNPSQINRFGLCVTYSKLLLKLSANMRRINVTKLISVY